MTSDHNAADLSNVKDRMDILEIKPMPKYRDVLVGSSPQTPAQIDRSMVLEDHREVIDLQCQYSLHTDSERVIDPSVSVTSPNTTLNTTVPVQQQDHQADRRISQNAQSNMSQAQNLNMSQSQLLQHQ